MAKLTAIFSARDDLSSKLKDMGRAGEEATGVFSNFGTVAAAGLVAFGAAAATVATKATLDFAQFQKGINEVTTILDNDGMKAIGNIDEKVKDFSKSMGVLPEKVVPALYESLSSGVPPDSVFSFLETAQKAAVAGVTETQTAVDALTTVTNTYGTDVIDANKASDIMFQTVKFGKTRFEELANSMSNVLPSAKAAGVNFEQVGSMMATVTSQGVKTAEATTKVRSMLDELAKPGQKANEVFQQLSGKGFRDFIAGGGTVQQALEMMNTKAKETGTNIGDMFGSVEAAGAAQLLTSKTGADMFTKFSDAMNNSAGSTEEAYNKMDRGIARTWEKIKARSAVALLDIGDALAPFVQTVSDVVLGGFEELGNITGPVLESIGKVAQPIIDAGKDIGSSFIQGLGYFISNPSAGLDENFQALKESIGNQLITLFGQDTGSVLSDGFLNAWYSFTDTVDPLIAQNMPKIIDFINNMVTNFQQLGTTLIPIFTSVFTNMFDGAVNIIGPTLGLIMGIGDGFLTNVAPIFVEFVTIALSYLLQFTDWFAQFYANTLSPFVAGIIEAFQSYILPVVFDVITTLMNDVFPLLVNTFNWIVNDILPIFQSMFEQVFPVIKNVVEDAFIFIQGLWENVLKPVWDVFAMTVQLLVPIFQQTFSVVFATVSQVITGIVQIFGGVIDFVTGIFTGNWSKAWTGVVEIFSGIFNGIAGLVKAPINAVIGIVNAAIDAINGIGFDVPDWVPLLGGKSFHVDVAHIPMLAKGTDNWGGGDAIVGEAGMELVTGPQFGDLPVGSKVYPNDQTKDILDSIGSGGSNVNQDNRQYNIYLPTGEVIKAEGEQNFKDRVLAAIEEILGDEKTPGGDLSLDY